MDDRISRRITARIKRRAGNLQDYASAQDRALQVLQGDVSDQAVIVEALQEITDASKRIYQDLSVLYANQQESADQAVAMADEAADDATLVINKRVFDTNPIEAGHTVNQFSNANLEIFLDALEPETIRLLKHLLTR